MPSFRSKKKTFSKVEEVPSPFALEAEVEPPAPRSGTFKKTVTQTSEEFMAFCQRNERKEIHILSIETRAGGHNAWYRFNYVEYDDKEGA